MTIISWGMIILGGLMVITGLKNKDSDGNNQQIGGGFLMLVFGILNVTGLGYELFYMLF